MSAQRSLITLKAAYNNLTGINDIYPPSLIKLDLSHNTISTIPTSLSVTITMLDLSHNRLTDVSELACLINLTEIALNYNQLSQIPASLSALTKLTTLSLVHNELRGIAAAVLQSTQLQHLQLAGNSLTKQQVLQWEGVDVVLERRRMTKDKLLQGGGLSDTSLFGLD
jgi:leucine-rich repeat protein SHOC2